MDLYIRATFIAITDNAMEIPVVRFSLLVINPKPYFRFAKANECPFHRNPISTICIFRLFVSLYIMKLRVKLIPYPKYFVYSIYVLPIIPVHSYKPKMEDHNI